MERKTCSVDVSEERKSCIVEMANAWLTHAHIAKYSSMPRSTISNIIYRSKIDSTLTIQKETERTSFQSVICDALKKSNVTLVSNRYKNLLQNSRPVLVLRCPRTLLENTCIKLVYVNILPYPNHICLTRIQKQ